MDSTDTPTGGLDGTTASGSARGVLPLSVDQHDGFASPRDASTQAGQIPTSSSSMSSSGHAFDRLDYVNRSSGINNDMPNALPTSTDDVMMPIQQHSSHPSVMTKETTLASSRLSPSSPLSPSSMGDSAEFSARSKVRDSAEKVKEQGKSMMDTISSKVSSAEKTIEDKYHQAKDELSQKAHSSSTSNTTPTPTAPAVNSTVKFEPTDTHPDAASMRDTHLHPGMVSLPTHTNEQRAGINEPHISEAHQKGLDAAMNAEPKDVSASGGVRGALSSMHKKLEDGAEGIKEKVDGFMDRNVRTDDTHHLSAAHPKDLPTLVDTSNEHNVTQVRAKMHPSVERAGNSVDDVAAPEEDLM